jgi:hypothetical protein
VHPPLSAAARYPAPGAAESGHKSAPPGGGQIAPPAGDVSYGRSQILGSASDARHETGTLVACPRKLAMAGDAQAERGLSDSAEERKQ